MEALNSFMASASLPCGGVNLREAGLSFPLERGWAFGSPMIREVEFFSLRKNLLNFEDR